MLRCQFDVVEYDKKHQIVFLRDLNLGDTSVTNDAEEVYRYVRTAYGAVRLVYQDSMGEWSEIIQVPDYNYPGDWRIAFEQWDGLFMDILKRGLK